MTFDDLLGYAEIHCRTELALFSNEHLDQLYLLAGRIPNVDLHERAFWNVGPDVIDPLVKAARKRLKGRNLEDPLLEADLLTERITQYPHLFDASGRRQSGTGQP
jgi:hypothetical protein